jgi:hypothetical protein
MNERQQALLAYLMTIGPHVRGFKSPDDLINRIMKCVREDAAFAAKGFVQGFIQFGQNVIEKSSSRTWARQNADLPTASSPQQRR